MLLYAQALGLQNAKSVIDDILVLSNLKSMAGRRAKSLSGGMRRRLCASIALMVGRNGGLVSGRVY